MEIPFSQACQNNQLPILKVLETLDLVGKVLEMGHGTGQHACFFAENLPVQWYPADRKENNWMVIHRDKKPNNLQSAIALEVGDISLSSQLEQKFDALFTANTLHIMSEKLALKFCDEVGEILVSGAKLIIYGPFKFDGQFTSDSNAQFDLHLKAQDPLMGIRDFEKIKNKLSQFDHLETIAMPANNFILVFKKK